MRKMGKESARVCEPHQAAPSVLRGGVGVDQLSWNGSGCSRWVELAVATGILIISGTASFVC